MRVAWGVFDIESKEICQDYFAFYSASDGYIYYTLRLKHFPL